MRSKASIPDWAVLPDLCRRWRIRRVALFGSWLRGDVRPESDIDLLVDFEPDERWTLFDLARAEEEFAQALGRRVDLAERRLVAASQNPFRRDAILESAREIWTAPPEGGVVR